MSLFSLTGWHWLTIGVLLLAMEAFGVGGILIGVGAAAILMALILAVVSIIWQVQLVLFGVFSLVFTVVFWKYFRAKASNTETLKLNNRMAQLVGFRASLLFEIKAGRGKVQIQDALWSVSCEEDLPVGTMVEVVSYEDTLLHVVKI